MKIYFYLLVIVILFSTSSCATSTKWYRTVENKSELKGGITALNGMYSNRPANYNDSIGINQNAYPLYTLLFEPYKDYEWDEYRGYGGHIKIEAISDKKIKVYYMVGDKVLEEKTISGTIKYNIFSVRRKILFIPLIVFSFFRELKTSIYFDKKGDLVVYNDKCAYANILFMSGGGENGHEGTFSRIIEKDRDTFFLNDCQKQ